MKTAEQVKAEYFFQDCQRLKSELEKACDKYDELLMAVKRTFPGETRHQTALRYIQEAERHQPRTAAEIIADAENQPRDEHS